MTDDDYAAARLRALVADHLQFEREQSKKIEPDRTVRVGDDRTNFEQYEIWRLNNPDASLEQAAELKRLLNL